MTGPSGAQLDPRWVAELEAENERLRAELAVARRSMPEVTAREPSPEAADMIADWYDSLDAAPAAATHVVDVRPMTDAERRVERLSPDPRDPWLAECTCGARMLPLLPGEANAWEQGHLGTHPT